MPLQLEQSDDAHTRIDNLPVQGKEPVRALEFVGWLPVFQLFGNCGRHPLFHHIRQPPRGFKFLQTGADQKSCGTSNLGCIRRSILRVEKAIAALVRTGSSLIRHAIERGVIRCVMVLGQALSLLVKLVLRGRSPLAATRFVLSRHFESQIQVPSGAILYLSSVPYTFGQQPWLIEIEDSTSLFHPFLNNGETATLEIRSNPYIPMVRDLLESKKCLAILTHMQSTAEALPRLFNSSSLADKVFHIPLGIPLPAKAVSHREDGTLAILFTNSWHQDPRNFYLRGGLDVLEAYRVLRERYPYLKLVLRSSIPPLPRHLSQMLLEDDIQVVGHYLSDDEMASLMNRCSIFLLPAARIHVVSVLGAMAYGQALVVSDGWGMEEYVQHGKTGLIVPGRAGRTSWMDHPHGMLREDYSSMFEPNEEMVERLVTEISRLVEEVDLRRELGFAARLQVANHHSLERWNRDLSKVLEKVIPDFRSEVCHVG